VRSKLSDQDLTDYALDELGPEERLYVESMLAVSEECRHDVYETIDLAMSIEEGFEREEGRNELVELTTEQRAALLSVQMPNRFWHRTAATVGAIAALVTMTLVTKDVLLPRLPSLPSFFIGRSSHVVNENVAQASAGAEPEDFVNPLASFRKITDMAVKLLPAQQPAGATVFGPPSSMFNVDASYSGLDFSE
jgi:hypothetical protein